jgi:hypothetical protein
LKKKRVVEHRDKNIKKTRRKLILFVSVLQGIDKKYTFEKAFNMLYQKKEGLGGFFLYEIMHHKVLDRCFNVFPEYKALKDEVSKNIRRIIKDVPSDSDWSIDELPKCSCEFCSELKEFLFCKTTQEKVWPLSKEKRQHIHQAIDQLKLPVSHETLRKGSPHQLILKKKSTLFSWRKVKYDRLKKLLEVPCA